MACAAAVERGNEPSMGVARCDCALARIPTVVANAMGARASTATARPRSEAIGAAGKHVVRRAHHAPRDGFRDEAQTKGDKWPDGLGGTKQRVGHAHLQNDQQETGKHQEQPGARELDGG